jgi:hypothetical protein
MAIRLGSTVINCADMKLVTGAERMPTRLGVLITRSW